MRRVLLCCRLTLVTLMLLCQALAAQPKDASDPSVPPVREPEEVGILEKRTVSGFLPLELHQANAESDYAFFGGLLTYLTIPGRHSSVRYRAGQPIEFYLKIFMDVADPRAAFFPVKDPTRFSLYPTVEEGDNRRVILSDAGLTEVSHKAGQPLLQRLFGQSSFLLMPTQPLPPGEYAIRYNDQSPCRLFCFGVDR